jgi:Fe-S cluster biosynthesis and repair protein YggX
MDVTPKINQFKQMAEADPDNDLAHFSLGKAYLDAARPQEAIAPLKKAIELNRTLSKAYQLLGEALHQAERWDEAIMILTQGVEVADASGDRLPRQAMANLLSELGAPVPAPPTEATDARAVSAESTGDFKCARCGSTSGKMGKSPFKGPVGEKVLAHVCERCWREWIEMGTKVINELGLQLADPKAQEVYDQYMMQFLQLERV